MVWLFEQRKKVEDINVEYIFCDTGAEHPKTYEFINNVVNHFGIDLTCIRADISLEKGIGSTYRVVPLSECKHDLVPFRATMMKHSTPTLINCHCTDRMKSTPSDKYCNDKYGRRNFTKWLGMRIDEPGRINNVKNQLEMFEIETKKKAPVNLDYLGNISDCTKQDVLDFWSKMPFDLEIPEWLGNCMFCIKKTPQKVALAARQEPEHAAKFIELINDPEIRVKMVNVQTGSYYQNSDDLEPIPIYETRELPNDIMYRQSQSLVSIVAAYADISEEDLIDNITFGKKLDTGSCSESCEATFSMDFGDDDND